MDMNTANIEEIVKQILANMKAAPVAAAPAAAGELPKTAKVAMLTQLEKFEIKE